MRTLVAAFVDLFALALFSTGVLGLVLLVWLWWQMRRR